jgi:hypothetical protein
MYLDGGMASKRTPGLGTVTAGIIAHSTAETDVSTSNPGLDTYYSNSLELSTTREATSCEATR